MWDPSVGIVLGTLLFAVLVMLICYLNILGLMKRVTLPWHGSLLNQYMGTLKLDLSDSWMTMLTAIGALSGTVLSSGLVHQPENVGLSLFFGLLVLCAPVLYRSTAKYIVPHNMAGVPESTQELQGSVGAFLLTSLLVIWAISGQLVTLIAILNDLSMATPAYFSPPLHYIFLLFLLLTLAGTSLYAVRTIPWMVEDQIQVANQRKEFIAASQPGNAEIKTGLAEGKIRPPLKTWTML
jgi:hypothetical protein